MTRSMVVRRPVAALLRPKAEKRRLVPWILERRGRPASRVLWRTPSVSGACCCGASSISLARPHALGTQEALVKRFGRSLYMQVITAVIIGAVIGHLYPAFGTTLKPLGEGFIKLVKMLIAPIVFATVVTGIAKMGDLKKVGRVGLKAIIYFEVLTTVALFIGLVVGKIITPGAGMNVDPKTLDMKAIASYT